jgi:GcrA cell cycle regulator
MRENSFWTPELIARLKELWTSGRSASACAFIINRETRLTISRNAVISRVHRSNSFGQSPRCKNPVNRATHKQFHQKAFPTKPRTGKWSFGNFPNSVTVAPIVHAPKPLPLALSVPILAVRPEGIFSVLDLREGKCKYPIGSHPMLLHSFCMADTPEGWPYCAEHQKLSRDQGLGALGQIRTAGWRGKSDT